MSSEKTVKRLMSKAEIMAEMVRVCSVLSEKEMLFLLDLVRSMVVRLERPLKFKDRVEEIIGLSLEERKALQQAAIDDDDGKWEEELKARNKAKAGITEVI